MISTQLRYYYQKSQETSPKWFMVDLTFTARAQHLVPLALLKFIAENSSSNLVDEIAYIGDTGTKAIKGQVTLIIAEWLSMISA